ncbi:diguanylate cyclase domain-containing protein [Trichloromonas sp.]|uniref:sensor domain-containing diguanylate cyclase n=1 Tax=Trichloromonas sp. TaxID=3069249 RepID=UPI002A41F4A5|nr:diguanylate cyclase [Trichloromonas sp.]
MTKFFTHSHKSFLLVGLLIFLLDILFVAINYRSAQQVLYAGITSHALDHEKQFGFALEMAYTNLGQLSLLISRNDELNQLFLAGKKAVEAEGGGAGGPQAERFRQALLARVKGGWDEMAKAFGVRQLHYHLGPGSLSFLRVHRPEKYGDRMDDLRHTIVDTHEEKTGRYGFETGRIYSGLRSVVPIWTHDPESGERTYVGALEVGTSFDQLLSSFADSYSVHAAVLLTKDHVESKMFPEFVRKFFADNPAFNFYLEAASSPPDEEAVAMILPKIDLAADFATPQAQLIRVSGKFLSAYFFPLYDYQADRQGSLSPSGFVLFWDDVSELVAEFRRSVWINILFAVSGFIVIEAILLAVFRRELRLEILKKQAMTDGLTGFFNRHYFDKTLERDLNLARRAGKELSLIVCDVDSFKKFNDRYGHQAGDRCLVEVAGAIGKALRRESDWAVRFGGEEFVVVLPGTDLAGARLMAERLLEAVRRLRIAHEASEVSPFVTLSAGIATSREADDPAELFNAADRHLYQAKEQGRDRWHGALE